jgi:hypothetical protein
MYGSDFKVKLLALRMVQCYCRCQENAECVYKKGEASWAISSTSKILYENYTISPVNWAVPARPMTR